MATSPLYAQTLLPDSDVVVEWGSTAATHWTEVDDGPGAPSMSDRIFVGPGDAGKIDRFGLSNPNKANLEGGFDVVQVYLYGLITVLASPGTVGVRALIKNVWQGEQEIAIQLQSPSWWGPANFYVYCCDVNDGDPLQVQFRCIVAPSTGQLQIGAAYGVIQASDVLASAKANLSAQII